jgi:hypothetical protein
MHRRGNSHDGAAIHNTLELLNNNGAKIAENYYKRQKKCFEYTTTRKVIAKSALK